MPGEKDSVDVQRLVSEMSSELADMRREGADMRREKADMTKLVVGLSSKLEELLGGRSVMLNSVSSELNELRRKVDEMSSVVANFPNVFNATMELQGDYKHLAEKLDSAITNIANITESLSEHGTTIDLDTVTLGRVEQLYSAVKDDQHDADRNSLKCSTFVKGQLSDIRKWQDDTAKPKLEKVDRMWNAIIGTWVVFAALMIIGGFILKAIDSYTLAHPDQSHQDNHQTYPHLPYDVPSHP